STDSQFETIGKYKILGTLGRGSMGVVYKGQDPEIGRIVAIKTLRKITSAHFHDPNSALERFKIEARSAGNLRHPNIITIFDVSVEGDTPYIVMDYVEGESLDTVLLREGKFSPEKTLSYLEQIASGLDAAHDKGIIHRDIKPSNLILDENGRLYILDFGVAKMNKSISDSEKSSEQEPVMGTPGYMSPEQILNEKLDARSDLFSFAIVAFECFTGRRPFSGDNFSEIIGHILHSPPLSLRQAAPELPESLEKEFEKAFSKPREGRHETAHQMVAAFRRLLVEDARTHEVSRTMPAPLGRDLSLAHPGHTTRARGSSEWQAIGETMQGLPDEVKAKTSPGESSNEERGLISEHERAQSFSHSSLTPHTSAGDLFEHSEEVLGSRIGQGSSSGPFLRIFTAVCIVGCFALLGGIYWVMEGDFAGLPDTSTTNPRPQVQVSKDPTASTLELPSVVPVPEGKLLSELSDQELLSVVMDKSLSEEVILKALKEAETRQVPQLLEATVVPLESDSYVVRIETVKLLGNLGDKRIVPVLVTKLDDYDPLVREQVAKALGELGSRKALGYLSSRYRTETSSVVKGSIRGAIERINGFPMQE
ncbi:MAG: protein kinase, partial [Bdellovibrionales bacterium]|nr:protein kinase [Bdellovibrionales bacterium]